MDQKIKQHIVKYCENEGWLSSDDAVEDTLTAMPRLSDEIVSTHRWWDIHLYVVGIDGMLIGFEYAHSTGDANAEDLGWVFNDARVWEMQSVERVVTVYERVSGGE